MARNVWILVKINKIHDVRYFAKSRKWGVLHEIKTRKLVSEKLVPKKKFLFCTRLLAKCNVCTTWAHIQTFLKQHKASNFCWWNCIITLKFHFVWKWDNEFSSVYSLKTMELYIRYKRKIFTYPWVKVQVWRKWGEQTI